MKTREPREKTWTHLLKIDKPLLSNQPRVSAEASTQCFTKLFTKLVDQRVFRWGSPICSQGSSLGLTLCFPEECPQVSPSFSPGFTWMSPKFWIRFIPEFWPGSMLAVVHTHTHTHTHEHMVPGEGQHEATRMESPNLDPEPHSISV